MRSFIDTIQDQGHNGVFTGDCVAPDPWCSPRVILGWFAIPHIFVIAVQARLVRTPIIFSLGAVT